MATPSGIFVLGPLDGPAAEEIHGIIRRFDSRLAGMRAPHVTLAGSSGVGPIPFDTPVEKLRAALAPVAETTPPLSITLGAPQRFPGTDIVVLPIAPYGPIRALHDRIAASGLRFARPRFAFSPHVTLSLYRTLTPATLAELLAVRAPGPVMLHRMDAYYTREPGISRLLVSLPLTGAPAEGT